MTTPAGCAPRRAVLPARLAALAPFAVGRDRVLPAGGYLQVSEEIYLACTSGGPRLDPADAFAVNGAARPDLPHAQRKRGGGNTVMALPIKLPAG